MAKCHNCSIEILDETEVCPLCRSVLEQTEPLEDMYPNVRFRMRRLRLASRIYLFCALLAEAFLFGLNYAAESEIWWSAITGMVLLYVYFVLRYTILGKSGYQIKIGMLAVLSVSAAVVIDFASGYKGWSVDYVLPGGILLVDAIIVGCMICNRRNWQSYMMWQLLMILCSLVPAFLYWKEYEHNPYLAFLPLIASCALFLGTVIIGDRKARTELSRRFHI